MLGTNGSSPALSCARAEDRSLSDRSLSVGWEDPAGAAGWLGRRAPRRAPRAVSAPSSSAEDDRILAGGRRRASRRSSGGPSWRHRRDVAPAGSAWTTSALHPSARGSPAEAVPGGRPSAVFVHGRGGPGAPALRAPPRPADLPVPLRVPCRRCIHRGRRRKRALSAALAGAGAGEDSRYPQNREQTPFRVDKRISRRALVE